MVSHSSHSVKDWLYTSTLRSWHKKYIDQTIPASVQAQSDKERIKALERECRELKQANEIIRKATGIEAQTETGRALKLRFSLFITIRIITRSSHLWSTNDYLINLLSL